MPFARIDLIEGKAPDYRAAVADIVYRGILDVLKATDGGYGRYHRNQNTDGDCKEIWHRFIHWCRHGRTKVANDIFVVGA